MFLVVKAHIKKFKILPNILRCFADTRYFYFFFQRFIVNLSLRQWTARWEVKVFGNSGGSASRYQSVDGDNGLLSDGYVDFPKLVSKTKIKDLTNYFHGLRMIDPHRRELSSFFSENRNPKPA